MKKGKTSKLNGYKQCKVLYGTVDSKDFKSLYINLQTWAEPKKEINKTNRVVSFLNKDVKNSIINSICKNSFKENFIVDLDFRHSGIILGKKSFLNLEVTLYLNEVFDFKSNILKNKIENIVTNLYNDTILNNDYFSFNTSKKEKKFQLT